MTTAKLGRTGLVVNKDGFGALPVQRVALPGAQTLLRAAFDAGIDFYDTARMYTDSEEKLGHTFAGMRDKIVLATKTTAQTAQGFWQDLQTSLRLLQTDYVDIYQFHNPAFCPRPGDGTGLYEAMLQARDKGLIRFIGLTNHRLDVAREAAESGLYDTIQYPFNYLATEGEKDLVQRCEALDVGFIAMKGMSGGLIRNVAASRAWLLQYPGAVPIWGIQRQSELDALMEAMNGPEKPLGSYAEVIEADRAELSGSFCRACGYCMPCPAGIEINSCARIMLWMRRAPGDFYTPEWRAKMEQVPGCLDCGQCKAKCPYGLDTPALLRQNYAEYMENVPV